MFAPERVRLFCFCADGVGGTKTSRFKKKTGPKTGPFARLGETRCLATSPFRTSRSLVDGKVLPGPAYVGRSVPLEEIRLRRVYDVHDDLVGVFFSVFPYDFCDLREWTRDNYAKRVWNEP